MAERFPILSDEHIPDALVDGLREKGYPVTRVVDEPSLGQRTPDERNFAYAAAQGLVWLTRDSRSSYLPAEWLREGKVFRGMLCWPQSQRMSIGEVLAFIEALSEEEDPFAAGIRWIKPRS